MSRYVNPVPGGTVGRTDQGVDISAAPGTPVRAIANETLVGIIQNWYQGQPFYWFREQGTNVYNYVAEQFSSRLRIGQSVSQGQEIGTVASSGTGLELGYATASGQTLARATTGYTEGQATPAGESYRQNVLQNQAGGPTGGQTSSLAQLWIQAGGSPALANTMAAIAMAESSGNPNATNNNSNGTVDRGLWQINSVHSQFDPNRLLTDPLYNAQAAVAIEKSSGLGAWTTYTSGAYKQFLNKPDLVQGYGGTRPGGGDAGPVSGASGSGPNPAIPQMLDNYVKLRDIPRTAPKPPNAFQWWWQSFTGNWQDLNQFQVNLPAQPTPPSGT